MTLEQHYPYEPEFRPVLDIGQTARLVRGTPDNYVDVEVKGMFALPVHRHAFGVDINEECIHLEMNEGELGQYRFAIRTRHVCQLVNPAGVVIQHTAGTSLIWLGPSGRAVDIFAVHGRVDDEYEMPDVRNALWQASEFFVFERETPRFNFFNVEPYAPPAPQVDFYGIGYILKKATTTPLLHLWVNGRPKGEPVRVVRRK